MIEQLYLIHRQDHNRYYHSEQSGLESNGNKSVLHILQIPELEPHH